MLTLPEASSALGFAFSKGTMLQVYGSVLADDGIQTLARFAIAKL